MWFLKKKDFYFDEFSTKISTYSTMSPDMATKMLGRKITMHLSNFLLRVLSVGTSGLEIIKKGGGLN